MRGEAYWLNISKSDNPKIYKVDDHAKFIKEMVENNDSKLINEFALKDKTIERVKELNPNNSDDYNELRVLAMRDGNMIRIRNQGPYVAAEFASRNKMDVFWTLYSFLVDFGVGDLTTLVLYNVLTNEKVTIKWKEFKDKLQNDSADEILRVAKISNNNTDVFRLCKIASILEIN